MEKLGIGFTQITTESLKQQFRMLIGIKAILQAPQLCRDREHVEKGGQCEVDTLIKQLAVF